jgi:hypothetical protein
MRKLPKVTALERHEIAFGNSLLRKRKMRGIRLGLCPGK